MKKRFALAVAVFTALFSVFVSASGYTEDFDAPGAEAVAAVGMLSDLDCASAILIEAKTGAVLYEQEPDAPRRPASITKIMTLLLIVEAVEDGKLALADTVTASADASKMGGSQIYLKEHEQMTVDELLKAIAVVSANDACVAMAEHMAGSEEAFVALMNEKAAKLGMKNTHFENCCGLDADGHLTTARDIATMSAALLSHDLIRNYSTVWTDSLRGGKFGLTNTNKLVRFYDGATGLKTGSTSLAGNCVSASAKRGETEYIAVVMGAKTSDARFNEAKKLLDYGFANFELVKLDTASEPVDVAVKGGVLKTVPASIKGEHYAVLEKGKASSVVREITTDEYVTAPVDKGQTVGEAVYTLDGEEIARLPVVASDAVPKAGFFFYFGELWKVFTA